MGVTQSSKSTAVTATNPAAITKSVYSIIATLVGTGLILCEGARMLMGIGAAAALVPPSSLLPSTTSRSFIKEKI